MELGLKGRTVLITGGSKGIGRACAEGFAAEGCRLHLVARTEHDLNSARAYLEASSPDVDVTAHTLDLARPGATEALVEAVPAVDVLVNNAGAIPPGDLETVDEARWREAWDLKVFGYINLTRAYYARMRERGGGVIVNVVGVAGEKPDPGYIAGTAGNAALMAFSRGAGARSLNDGIRVVAVNPGPVETERIALLMQARAEREKGDAGRWREYFEALPLGRPAKPEEVADLVVYLASPRAAYVSGTVITINGGGG